MVPLSDPAAPCGSSLLAYNQSFGFFDDVSDENWKRAQRIHARLFPNHLSKDMLKYSSTIADRGNFRKLKSSSWWYGENFQVEFHCPLSQRVPATSEADGPKWVCDGHRIANQDSCLVYSFGSNGKVEFERGVKEEISPHCEVHTFDMATRNKRNGDFQRALEGYAAFHPWGLGTQEQSDHYRKTKSGPAYKTLRETMEELGHVGRRIDVFKIDCEWCEWHTFREWLQHDLRQILVETHNAPMPNAGDFFREIHDAGYVIFSKEANYQNGAGAVEYAFLKLSTDFMDGNLYSNEDRQVSRAAE